MPLHLIRPAGHSADPPQIGDRSVSSSDLAQKLKNVSEKDRKQIEQAQEMLGPDPTTMGFIKNLFWGNFREELVFPFPEVTAEEVARCDQLVAGLDEYLRNEHPTIEIDQTQQIPDWAIKKLFDLGVMGMIIPQEYGGGSYGLTSYNRVLKRIGQTCGSTAVMVSAHQSIGCGALVLFGTDEQKKRFLPRMATDTLSAFCLSEPNVGCDAGGQETYCEKTDDGDYIIVSGEKKWATSAALAGLFTVMTKQKIVDPKTGKERERVTALICTPDMEGIDIFSRNRSKVCIRGTWQARIRFNNVRVPKENLLHKEGKGLNVALTCLNYGRCTLSAGMVGAAQAALEQAGKWAQYRYQFDRPLAEFDLVQDNLAHMQAYLYATEAMLYMTTGMVDRGDEDIMLETALCKVFCSEMGYQTVNRAMQIMGGEGFMTENELERLWRDSRINTVVEGANEVMHSFVFAYGSKQLGEFMIGVKEKPFANLGAAMRLGLELFLGLRRPAPHITKLSPRLAHLQHDLERDVREFSHQIKRMFKVHEEGLITNQMIQRRLALSVMWLHAATCCLARVDGSIRRGINGDQLRDELTIVEFVCRLASREIGDNLRRLDHNDDDAMRACAKTAVAYVSSLPNEHYAIPESSPDDSARGHGRHLDQSHIQQFGSGTLFQEA
ncbi:MAG: acyl-CoA dehydrogenase [Phycisphaerales bacterium]|nr:acyl-CoA dehydrogenase family protein [Phycisphaerae bacterium]NNF42597.1 acyl-CoA dehydrogenase [Phycisphaerales bacterium]NNM24925.1 acyl-CoA dehydrogenase [Phycisphaerales bacterium]